MLAVLLIFKIFGLLRPEPKAPEPEKRESRPSRPLSDIMKTDIHRQIAHLRRDGRRASHWVVSPEWYAVMRTLTDSRGMPLVVEGPEDVRGPVRYIRPYLMGIPVHVHEWARIPLLIPHT